MKKLTFLTLAILLTSASASVRFAKAEGKTTQTNRFDHVMVVVLENSSYGHALRKCFLSSLTKRGALLSNYHGVVHPSQPNYISMVAGSPLTVKNDKNTDIDANHLGDLLEKAGKTWKIYAEEYPGGCFLGAKSGKYVRKHTPFLSFKNIQESPSRCANIVNANELEKDIANQSLANFSMYIPTLRDDGHNTGVGFADRWLKSTFGPLLENPDFMKGMLVVFTFDESGRLNPTNHIYTAMVGDSVKAGVNDSTEYNHYSLLRTIEDNFQLESLGRGDSTATPISGIWK